MSAETVEIREATERDVSRLVEMGVHFLRAHYAAKMKENPAEIAKTFSELMQNPKGRVLVAENGAGVVGMLAFVVYPLPFSGETVAGELAWWVEPQARGRAGLELLHEAERIARELGSKQLFMVSPSETTSQLYERLGYREVETMYQRAL